MLISVGVEVLQFRKKVSGCVSYCVDRSSSDVVVLAGTAFFHPINGISNFIFKILAFLATINKIKEINKINPSYSNYFMNLQKIFLENNLSIICIIENTE
ncbi:Succinate--CoA ligase [ADP-forming] subunit beta [Trichinella pseudospiralis]